MQQMFPHFNLLHFTVCESDSLSFGKNHWLVVRYTEDSTQTFTNIYSEYISNK